ncbi:MAG TPA: hypothetical protein VEU73_04275 [Gemmatimonadales bacterium]|nr:hypothetical protein [Gemmatimonadales bacterium]
MPKNGAGLLLYRRVNGVLQVLLVHPGGPFWAARWRIVRGQVGFLDQLAAAVRQRSGPSSP